MLPFGGVVGGGAINIAQQDVVVNGMLEADVITLMGAFTGDVDITGSVTITDPAEGLLVTVDNGAGLTSTLEVELAGVSTSVANATFNSSTTETVSAVDGSVVRTGVGEGYTSLGYNGFSAGASEVVSGEIGDLSITQQEFTVSVYNGISQTAVVSADHTTGILLQVSDSIAGDTSQIGILEGSVNILSEFVPTAATDPGTLGDIAFDTNYIYYCVATNTWKRSPLSTWP
jgi:hypothetical protein